jgi:beta-glucanase (GH16 family)
MKMPAWAGLWPAFWLLGAGQWPSCGEIDIMETVGEADWASVALHGPGYSGENALVNKKYFPAGQEITHWHVYSVEWNPSGFLFQIDDELIYRVTRPMTEFYGKWVFDRPQFIILNFALGGVYPFKTNGVREPYYGIPAETVAAIQNNEIKFFIDWVKVTNNPNSSAGDKS